jgi:hypothetical protein
MRGIMEKGKRNTGGIRVVWDAKEVAAEAVAGADVIELDARLGYALRSKIGRRTRTNK